MSKTFIGTVEAGEILGRNPSTVAKMIKDGKLKGAKVGKKWMLPYADVIELSKTIKPSNEVSRANMMQARQTIKPKPISNKKKKSPTANLSTRAAIERLEPTFLALMASIRARQGVGDALAQWQAIE